MYQFTCLHFINPKSPGLLYSAAALSERISLCSTVTVACSVTTQTLEKGTWIIIQYKNKNVSNVIHLRRPRQKDAFQTKLGFYVFYFSDGVIASMFIFLSGPRAGRQVRLRSLWRHSRTKLKLKPEHTRVPTILMCNFCILHQNENATENQIYCWWGITLVRLKPFLHLIVSLPGGELRYF